MKKVYIKPVCETEYVLNAKTMFAASDGVTVTIPGGGGPGYGGEDDGSHDPDVKADQDWDIWN